jgi:hypothetical protein
VTQELAAAFLLGWAIGIGTGLLAVNRAS